MSSVAWLWSNEELADVRLQLCTVQPASVVTAAEEESPPSSSGAEGVRSDGRKRGADGSPEHQPHKAARCSGAGAGVTPTVSGSVEPLVAHPAQLDVPQSRVSYRLHASVLASSSAYFKKRITQQPMAELRYADGGSSIEHSAGTGPQLTRCRLVEHVEEGDLDAMEAVLRHCYTGQLCAEGQAVAQVTVAALLQMLVLSDRFDVTLCVAHCCEELATRAAADFAFPAVNVVLSSAPGGWQAVPAFRRVVDTATQRILHTFGDAEAVAATCHAGRTIEAQLQQLSLPSLLALLSSASLRSPSKNSVLRLADQWLTGSVPRQCSHAELRQVASALRLGRLSYTYTHCVLPHLAWLKLDAAEHASLLSFSAAGGEGPRNAAGRTSRQEHLISRGRLSGPGLWYSALPCPVPAVKGDVVAHWVVSRHELKEDLLTASQTREPAMRLPTASQWVYFNGFAVHFDIFVDGAAGAEGARLVCTADSNIIEMGGHDHGIRLAVKCGVYTAGREKQVTEFCGVCESGEVMLGHPLLAPPCPGVFDMASWEGFMVADPPTGDWLFLHCTVAACE